MVADTGTVVRTQDISTMTTQPAELVITGQTNSMILAFNRDHMLQVPHLKHLQIHLIITSKSHG